MLAEGVPFIAPVVIDDTKESGASVPAEFLRVQWMRLLGALPTPQFVEQVKRLLEAPRKAAPAGRAVATPAAVALARDGIPPWVWAAAVIVVGGAVAFFALRPSAKESAPPATAVIPAVAPQSEARQLTAQAWALWEKQDNATRDDWTLADQLCQRALALDPADGDLWAAQSQVSLGFIIFGFDTLPARFEAARTQAERAVRLAPNSNEAQFAQANYFRRQATTRDEGVRILRQLVERMPADKRVLRTLASALRGQGRYEDSILYSDRAIALPGGDPVAMFGKEEALRGLGRSTEGENILDQVIAVHPSPVAYLKKLLYVVSYKGDLDRARTLVEKLPAPYLLEEYGAVWASTVALWRREPDKVLAVLNAIPKDYIEKGDAFSGPKAYRTGLAREMMGNTEAARSDWRAALEVVEQRLKVQANSLELLGWRALLLARLGERTEAEQALRIYEQLVRASDPKTSLGDTNRSRVILIHALLDKQDEFMDQLIQIYPQPTPALRYSPDWDVLRGNPRFDAWLKSNDPKK